MKVLIVEDDALAAEKHEGALIRAGFPAHVRAANAEEGIAAIEEDTKREIGLALIDWHLPKAEDGTQLVRRIRALAAAAESPYIIMVSGEPHHYNEALCVGANDFLQKPLLDHLLRASLDLMRRKAEERERAVAESQQLGEELMDFCRRVFEGQVYVADGLEAVLKQVARAAPCDVTVLITGPTGSGKEAIAGAIHKASRRSKDGGKDRELVMVNCAAIPGSLAESELFGHERGGFTGATQRHIGFFERANNGTLFLDEIGDLSLDLQAKILRVIEYGTFQRVGGSEVLRTDARIIAATWQSLEDKVKEGTFREDLYYRLNIIRIELPSLRDRRSVIPKLANRLYSQLREKHGQVDKLKSDLLPEATIHHLVSRDWQGSVRELRNAIEAGVILSDGPTLTPADFGADASPARAQAPPPWHEGVPKLPCNFDLELDRYAAAMIRAAMKQGGGTFAGAARLLKGLDNEGHEIFLKENKVSYQYEQLRAKGLLENLRSERP